MREGVFYCVYRVFILAVVALLVLFLAFDKWECPEELIPLGGLCLLVVLLYLLSAHRTAVSSALSQPLNLCSRMHGHCDENCFETCSGVIAQVISVCFAETFDINWPCAHIILGFSRSAFLRY